MKLHEGNCLKCTLTCV